MISGLQIIKYIRRREAPSNIYDYDKWLVVSNMIFFKTVVPLRN